MGWPSLANLDVSELCGAAGGDPWKLDDELQAGNAGAINDLADAFHRSGNHVKEADDDFDKAKQKFKDAYKRNDTEHPINDSAEVRRVTDPLGEHKEALPRIAAALEEAAASLAIAQRDSEATIAGTNSQLQEIDNQMSAAKAENADTGGLHAQAVGAVRAALGHVEEIRGAYAAQLRSAEAAMMASGYVPDVLDNVDGVPGDAPADAARQYDQSGQRARDHALVDKAKAEGRSDSLAGIGQPGHFSQEEADAEARLRDYKTITDPSINDPGRNAIDVHDRAQARRLAGERLDDYNVLDSTGLVAKDPVLGGDARTRAQARLKLQQDLENGNLSWHQNVMTPDQATQLMDEMEATDRANALVNLQAQLQQAGMSPDGACKVAEDLSHGKIPKEYVEAAAAGSKPFEAGEKGIERYAGLVEDHGRHWTPEAAAYNAQDVEALRKLGGRIGAVGSVIELRTAAYEIFGEHKSPVEVGVKAAGGFGGMWAGAEALGPVGAMIGGPPGAFFFALAGGVAGASGGEWLAEHGYKWLTN